MNKQKINTVFEWLQNGYSVVVAGQKRTNMWTNGKHILISHFGQYAIKNTIDALEKELDGWDDDFYIVDGGKIKCTDEVMEKYCNTTINTFSFHKRYIMSNTIDKKPLFVKKCTIAEIITTMCKLAEEYKNEHPKENLVHFVVNRENDNNNFPMWNSWNFAT
jgi:hypothetical protein